MKTNVEIRQTTREVLSKGWLGRVFVTGMVLCCAVVIVMFIVMAVLRDMEVQTWNEFLWDKAESLMQRKGMDYAVPGKDVAMQMSWATLFQQFFRYLFWAIVAFGIARVALKAVRGDEQGWFSASFDGFARPFGVMWLLVRMNIQVMLWSLLFVVPGFVAIYRYRQAWYLKSDHPDWGAGKCLAVSGEKMRGLKWQAFCLDFFYIVHVFVVGVLLSAVLSLARVLGGAGLVIFSAFAIGIVVLAMTWLIRIGCALVVARAEFYRAMPWEGEMSVCEAQKGEI